MTDTDGEALDDLPPSAKLVFKVLEYDALERLEGIGVVDEDVYFADARQNLYQLNPPEPVQPDGGAEACSGQAD